MINIDSLTIKAFINENIDFLKGARLQKIQQPTRRDFILFLRNNGESKKLYININPQIYHIAFMSKQNEERRSIVIPKKPPMFCMLLRKYIESARIVDAVAIDGERIIELYFENFDELSEKRLLCFSIELMGKHSNIILYDKKTNIIVGCAHNVGSEKSRYRELQGGYKYIYPPKSKIKLSNELKEQFKGLTEKKINEYLYKTNYYPAIKDERYTLFSELIPDSELQNSVNDMLDNYYASFQEKDNLYSLKNKMCSLVNIRLKKINNAISKISLLLNQGNNTEKYKLYGDLLKANIYKQYDYQSMIEVVDYINNQNIKIELDRTKTLKENAQHYYYMYAKSKKSHEKSEEMLNKLNIEKSYYEDVLYSIDTSQNINDLEEIQSELNMENDINPKIRKLSVEKMKINNFDIYIGKNNRQNDYIISKLAKDNDYWFHTKACAGSHILLKVNDIEPNDEVLLECCKLARKYSSAGHPSKIGVIYTRAKYLKKPPAAPLGYVTYKNEKEILI